ncbi:hypothetical protein [Streptomyces ipomoeae]|uniref:hypothetical protein n=1 Tax=Streptomyces ipomoeae TaxID=103232 RepID=UPI0011469486|nr:hypothetical protein [Streptomyces ipomoeae]MDX2939740.1 hypothetical protein [Streptomyces ipomoeae]TQE25287.1 hypothetical protein SipoB123_16650 [Streptomyces ipomoeae]
MQEARQQFDVIGSTTLGWHAMKTLAELEEFKNDDVVHRFLETWDIPMADAEELFEDMKKWLWLGAYAQDAIGDVFLGFGQSTKLIDEMWHTFILFTNEYHEFCLRYFGRCIHHAPTPKRVYDETIARYERDPDTVMKENREAFTKQYELVYETLGEETLIKWYDTYHEKYTDEYMRSVWRWSFSPYDTRVGVATAGMAVDDSGAD